MPHELDNFSIASELLSLRPQGTPSLPDSLNQPEPRPDAMLGLIEAIQTSLHGELNLFASFLAYLSGVSAQPPGGLDEFAQELQREWGVKGQSAPLGAEIQNLWRAVNKDPGLRDILLFAAKRLGVTDPAHDVHHVLRVAFWGLQIASEKVDPRHLMAAVFLHDVVNLPKNDPKAKSASRMASDVSRAFLTEIAFAPPEDIDKICLAIEQHSYSRGLTPSSDLGRALQDADRLDALGSTGVIRLFAVGHQLGAEPFDPSDPWASRRPLNDKKFTLDHFFTKIFHLAETMCTAKGVQEATLRTTTMRRFTENLKHECLP